MYKQTLTYEDFNGDTVTESHHFNLSKREIKDLFIETPNFVDDFLSAFDTKPVIDKKTNKPVIDPETGEVVVELVDRREAAKAIDYIVDLSYGVKTEDGKRFIKSKELLDTFKTTGFYDELMIQLIIDQELATNFFNGIFPKEIQEKAKTLTKEEIDKVLEEHR